MMTGKRWQILDVLMRLERTTFCRQSKAEEHFGTQTVIKQIVVVSDKPVRDAVLKGGANFCQR